MANLRQHSAAPVAGGSRISAATQTLNRRASHAFQTDGGNTRFLRTLIVSFITNEWMCREGAESLPLLNPSCIL